MKIIFLAILCICFPLSACSRTTPRIDNDDIAPPIIEAIVTETADEGVNTTVNPTAEPPALTTADVDSAHAAAIAYYNTTSFSGRVQLLSQIDDPAQYAAYLPTDQNAELVIAFEAVISDADAPRIIILTKLSDGIWHVINEGY